MINLKDFKDKLTTHIWDSLNPHSFFRHPADKEDICSIIDFETNAYFDSLKRKIKIMLFTDSQIKKSHKKILLKGINIGIEKCIKAIEEE